MKKSEKILLGIFGAVFLVIVGGGLLMFGLSHYQEVRAEIDTLRFRLADMNQAIAQGEEWQQKSAWLEQHVPTFNSPQEAKSHLLDAIQQKAEKAGLTISGQEFLESAKDLGPDGMPVEEMSGYFDQASVKVTFSGVLEKPLFAWMHDLQQPESFLGVTRLQINPTGLGKAVNVEVDVTQFYRQKPSSVVKADTGG
jgi:hypothetical protein